MPLLKLVSKQVDKFDSIIYDYLAFYFQKYTILDYGMEDQKHKSAVHATVIAILDIPKTFIAFTAT